MTAQTPVVRVVKLREGAAVPAYQSAGAAGLDLSACPHPHEMEEFVSASGETKRGVVLRPGDIRLIPCGVIIAVPEGFEGQVRPRSGLATRHGIGMPNAPGTVDSDYRGEAMVPLINLGRQPFCVEPGMRIAQMVIAPVARAQVRVVESLEATARGEGGFGSTGLHASAGPGR
ncbi:MAG: dUTP diphosphatase [Phycisphaerales bacterium]|nr:dUTP diphosphatase [Phycisphaerales bacterium]